DAPKITSSPVPSTIQISGNTKPKEALSNIINSSHILEIQPISQRLEKFSSKLDSKTLFNTFLLTREIIKESKVNSLWWSTPLVNVSCDSDVVLEWWNKSKKLTFYINQSSLDYIKVWGSDIDDEMEDGSINSMHDYSIGRLWQWISS
ncbi:MAG: hypothetical protein ACKPCM_15805, partial [Pseudanabaena sp.]